MKRGHDKTSSGDDDGGAAASAAPAARARSTAGAAAAAALPNPHLAELDTDHLYHFGLNSSMPLAEMFGDVKFVCMGGSAGRMHKIALRLVDVLGVHLPTGTKLAPIGKTERFSMYKVGPVVCVNHGMGMPSMSILLHELTKLLHYAGATDFIYMRIGTSGGLGVPPGTVVVTTESLNGELKAEYALPILGKVVRRPTKLNDALCDRVMTYAKGNTAVKGKTMGTDAFYEGQGRLDGAICEYTNDDKMAFLRRCHDEAGVLNIEMEATAFAAFCNRTGVQALVLCCTLLDRLQGDQIDSTPEQLASYVDNAIGLACDFIRGELEAARARRSGALAAATASASYAGQL